MQKVDGQKPIKILQFLLDHNGSIKNRNEIIAYVWGDDNVNSTSNEALSVACARANKALSDDCRIECIRNKGYRIKVELTKVVPVQSQAVIIHEKVPINKFTLAMCVASLVFLLFNFFAVVPATSNIAPSYTLTSMNPVFTRDSTVSRPLLSPDGK